MKNQSNSNTGEKYTHRNTYGMKVWPGVFEFEFEYDFPNDPKQNIAYVERKAWTQALRPLAALAYNIKDETTKGLKGVVPPDVLKNARKKMPSEGLLAGVFSKQRLIPPKHDGHHEVDKGVLRDVIGFTAEFLRQIKTNPDAITDEHKFAANIVDVLNPKYISDPVDSIIHFFGRNKKLITGIKYIKEQVIPHIKNDL